MRLLKVDKIEEARCKLLEAAGEKVPDTECTGFMESCGRILAQDIPAAENVPGFRKSTVDGYAVMAKNTQGVTDSIPVFLEVVGEVLMGQSPGIDIRDGQAVYVPTGGMLPDGADAVVMIEYVEKFDENSIAVYDSVSPGRNVILEGEDLADGDVFLKKGTVLRPQEIGLMPSAGISEVPVFMPWSISVISTGDEIVAAGQEMKKGQTRDINTYSLSAAAEKHGFRITEKTAVKDGRESVREAIRKAMSSSDVVLVSGGSSQGEKDFTAEVMDQLSDGGVFTHGIAIKPGKPTIIGYDSKSSTILAGLPGHPVAALMIFELFIAWLYRKLTGQKEPVKTAARMTENIASAGGKATCILLELREGEDGIYDAIPVLGKSGIMTTMTRADGYTVTGTDAEGLREGEIVAVTLF